VLRLASIGIDIEDLEFYHSPSRRTIKLAKATLRSLGATSDDGTVTEIGQKMERFPVESSYARMLVEAEQCSPLLQAQLASIIAIQEVGGIVKGSPRHSGWRRFTHHTRSDLLAEYDVLLAMPTIDPLEYEDLGIIEKNVTKAQDVNERLNRDLGLGPVQLLEIADNDVDQLLMCIVAGQLHQVWLIEPTGAAFHLATKQIREVSSGTVVRRSGLITGTPFDLQVPRGDGGLETLHLVNDITMVDPRWLEHLAPGQYAVRYGKKYFDARSGSLQTRMLVTYGRKTFEAAGVPVIEHTPENQKLFVTLFSLWTYEQLLKELRLLKRANPHVPSIASKQVQERIRYLAPGAISLTELSKKQQIELAKLSKVETYFGSKVMQSLRQPYDAPRRSFRHHGWQEHHKHKHQRHR